MTQKLKQIGIMGGTFDPIHLAHLEMARCAMLQKRLDKVLFMPSKLPPHKRDRQISPEKIREHMVQLAVEENAGFEYSDFELRREGITYTAKTLELLSKEHPDSKFYFIMGGDSLFQLEHWYMPEKILHYADVLAVSRDGVQQKKMLEKAAYLSEKLHGTVEVLQMKEMPISSSMIREKAARGESVCEYLPEKVEEYIRKKRLYV